MSELTPRYGNIYYPTLLVRGTYTPPPAYVVDGPVESPPDPRSEVRWILLSLAYDILKARHPERSPNELYLDLAEHYGCTWDTVRKAREYVRQRRTRHIERGSGVRRINLATLDLPRLPVSLDDN